MSQFLNQPTIDSHDKLQLENYLVYKLSNLLGGSPKILILNLLEKFAKTPPRNPNSLEQAFNIAFSLMDEDKALSLIGFLDLLPEKKSLIRRATLEIVQGNYERRKKLQVLNSFIDQLINNDQQFLRDSLLELVFVIKGDFPIGEQISLYKKLIPFLTLYQIDLISKGIIGQISISMPYSDHYLALLAVLENLDYLPIPIEVDKTAYMAFSLLKSISKSKQEQTDNSTNVTFEQKVKLVKFLAAQEVTQLIEILKKEVGSIQDPNEKLKNLIIMFNHCEAKNDYIERQIKDLKEEIEEIIITLNTSKSPSYTPLVTTLSEYSFDDAVNFLKNTECEYSCSYDCTVLASITSDQSKKNILEDLALKAIKKMSKGKLIQFSYLCNYLPTDRKKEFIKETLLESTFNELERIIPKQLREILLNLDPQEDWELIKNLFKLSKTITSYRDRVTNMLCFLPYLKEVEDKQEVIDEAVDSLRFSKVALKHEEEVIGLLIRYVL